MPYIFSIAGNNDVTHDFTRDFAHDFTEDVTHDVTPDGTHDFTHDVTHLRGRRARRDRKSRLLTDEEPLVERKNRLLKSHKFLVLVPVLVLSSPCHG